MRSSTGGGATFILAAAVLWGTTGAAATVAPDVTALTIGATAMGIGGAPAGGFAGRLVRRHRVALAEQWRR